MILTPTPRIPTLIPSIPIISTLIPSIPIIPTLIPSIPIIPVIPFPNSLLGFFRYSLPVTLSET